jgi:hypothetical protein
MSRFHLRFLIRLRNNNHDFDGPLFHRWLPNGKEDALDLHVEDHNVQLKVWFNRYGETKDSLVRFDSTKLEVDSEVMSEQSVLCAGPMLGVLEIDNLADGQLLAVRENRVGDPDYVALGKKVVNLIHPSVSSFINILRTNFGQYWLKELEKWDSRKLSLGMYCCKVLEAQWSLDEGQTWVKFVPDNEGNTIALRHPEGKTYRELLTEQDWQKLQQTLVASYQPDLSASLVSNAHRLLQVGEIKHALIETVTALEIALKEYLKQGINGEKVISEKLKSFWNLSLSEQFALVAVIGKGFLLNDIHTISDLIKERNKVAHEGLIPSDSDKVTREIRESLNIIARLISGPTFKFPQPDLEQFTKSPEDWEKFYKGEDNLIVLITEKPLPQRNEI